MSKTSISPAEYVCDLWNTMYEIQKHVRQHLGIAAEKQKRDHDTRVSLGSYNVGDLVYYLDSSRKIGLSPKLKREPWKGPYVVSKKLSDLLYEISGSQKNKRRVMHHDRLKPYLSDSIPDWVPAIQKLFSEPRKAVPIEKTIDKPHARKYKAFQKTKPVVMSKSSDRNDNREKRNRRAPSRYGFD